MKKNKVMAVAMTAAILFSAFLCCSLISDSSEATFSTHESNRGVLTNSTLPNENLSGTNYYGTVLNPYTGVDYNLADAQGLGSAYVKVGSQVTLITGTTAHNHNYAINSGWSYSNGVYTCTVTANTDNTPYLSNPVRSLDIHPVSNPGFLNSGEYWYYGSNAAEPLLGINISNINDLKNHEANARIYVAVGAIVVIDDDQNVGELWESTAIGLSSYWDMGVRGTVTAPGIATLHGVTFCAVEYSEPAIITASDMVVIQNTTLTFTPVPSGNTVSISGAPWLSVNGNVVSGTPTVVGDYTVTITSGASSKTITIRVISQLNVTNSPANGVIIMPS